jgi:hypothetical protein
MRVWEKGSPSTILLKSMSTSIMEDSMKALEKVLKKEL